MRTEFRPKNMYDAYTKVRKTYESCSTREQVCVTEKMQELFRKMYNDDELDKLLRDARDIALSRLLGIVLPY